MKAQPQTPVALATAALAVILGWLCTSPSFSMGMNWDTAGYAADIGNAGPWAAAPWNSHYGVGHVYWLMMHLMAWLGASPLDGIRMANAIALAWSGVALTLCARSLGLRPVMRLAVAGLYLTAWGTLLLVATWEDNVLVQPAALSALALCLDRVHAWRWRDSLGVGVLVGLSSLMSWQGAAYLLPASAAALTAGRERAWRVRLRDTTVVPVAFAGMRALWTIAFWLSETKMSLLDLLRIAFERPSPSFLPGNLAGWLGLLTDPLTILVHAGVGVAHELGPAVRDLPGIKAYLPLLGSVLIGSALFLWLGLVVVLRQRVNVRVRFLAVAFLLLTAATIVYLDLPGDKYKRYDYLPIFAALGIPASFVWIERWFAKNGMARKRIRCCGPVVAGLLILAQSLSGYYWNRRWYEAVGNDPSGYFGRAGQTWLAAIRAIREQNPQACSYVFAFSEVANGRYQLEIPAALASDLPRALVIDAPGEVSFWNRTLPMADASFVKANLHGCEWLSPLAQSRLTQLH